MTVLGPPAEAGARSATLGRLPFSLAAAELSEISGEMLAVARTRLAALLGRTEPPTVAEFLRPLDSILLEVRNVSNHGNLIFQVHPDAATREAGRRASEEGDRFFNEFYRDAAAYRGLADLDLSREEPRTVLAVEKMRREMRRAGVELEPRSRSEIVALANEIDRTCNEFAEGIQRGQRTFELPSAAALRGLPDDYRTAHAPAADGRVRVTTHYPDVFPVLSYAEDPEVRRRALFELMNVGFPPNLEVLGRLLRRRADFAQRLGYADFSVYATEDKMLERPEAVEAFLDRLALLLDPAARDDLARFLDRKRRDEPTSERLEPWDAGFWGDGFYDTRLRQEEFGVDPRELRAFLPYPAVRDGLFRLCEELFHLTIRPHSETRLWHPSVEAFDVERDGRPFGRFYLDLVPREGKFNHAAQFDVRTGLLGSGLPQAALICNFLDPNTPPAAARMEYRDVVTFFHEFGHLLHALFSGHGPWLFTTMTHIEWDFVEAPSQLFEEWARDPATLGRIARDPDTGAPIPRELLERAAAADALGRAARHLRQVALASISLAMYRADPARLDTTRLFAEIWGHRYPAPVDPEYHPQAAWGHLTGYSACYYTYVWSAVIARDLLTPFRSSGSLTDPATAERYAEQILAPGSSRPAADLVRTFLGRDFDFRAYERWVLEGSARPKAAE